MGNGDELWGVKMGLPLTSAGKLISVVNSSALFTCLTMYE